MAGTSGCGRTEAGPGPYPCPISALLCPPRASETPKKEAWIPRQEQSLAASAGCGSQSCPSHSGLQPQLRGVGAANPRAQAADMASARRRPRAPSPLQRGSWDRGLQLRSWGENKARRVGVSELVPEKGRGFREGAQSRGSKAWGRENALWCEHRLSDGGARSHLSQGGGWVPFRWQLKASAPGDPSSHAS